MQTPTAAPQTKHRKHLAKKILASGLQCGAYVGLERLSCDRKVDYQLMRQEDAKWVADEQLTDRLIAVGKPSAPIEGGDNAIVLAREKRSYLLQSTNQDPELTAILNHVELAYFSFKPMPTKDTPHFAIRIGESGCPSRPDVLSLSARHHVGRRKKAKGADASCQSL